MFSFVFNIGKARSEPKTKQQVMSDKLIYTRFIKKAIHKI